MKTRVLANPERFGDWKYFDSPAVFRKHGGRAKIERLLATGASTPLRRRAPTQADGGDGP